MSKTNPPAEELIRPLLERLDRLGEHDPPAEHPDEETLALFARGALDATARAVATEHLARCVDCRKAVGLLLSVDLTGSLPPQPRRPGLANRKIVLANRKIVLALGAATAAGLLAAVICIQVFRTDSPVAKEEAVRQKAVKLLAMNEYDQVRELVQEAGQRGIRSDGLKNIESQAVRHMPEQVALACNGRLSDFGYRIDGVVARALGESPGRAAAQQAEELLAGLGDQNIDVVLNRGHARLALDDPQAALVEFQKAVAAAPEQPLAWLGQGIAHYMRDDYPAAENDFRQCLRLSPHLVAAKINLAMTLDEQGRTDQSLPLWKSLLAETLSAGEREKIQEQIKHLQRQEKSP